VQYKLIRDCETAAEGRKIELAVLLLAGHDQSGLGYPLEPLPSESLAQKKARWQHPTPLSSIHPVKTCPNGMLVWNRPRDLPLDP
jgi:hypothetical protein